MASGFYWFGSNATLDLKLASLFWTKIPSNLFWLINDLIIKKIYLSSLMASFLKRWPKNY